MELLEIFSLSKLVKMGGVTRLLVNFLSMEVSNLSESMRSGVANFHILPIFGLTLMPQGGVVVVSLVPTVIMVPILLLEAGLEDVLIPL